MERNVRKGYETLFQKDKWFREIDLERKHQRLYQNLVDKDGRVESIGTWVGN